VVKDYLVSQGIPVSRITAAGKGSQTLIVSDTTEAARTINRRVEIRVTRKP
jgi:outer membrane protein OmpA-like peptidoglycan-associated protein